MTGLEVPIASDSPRKAVVLGLLAISFASLTFALKAVDDREARKLAFYEQSRATHIETHALLQRIFVHREGHFPDAVLANPMLSQCGPGTITWESSLNCARYRVFESARTPLSDEHRDHLTKFIDARREMIARDDRFLMEMGATYKLYSHRAWAGGLLWLLTGALAIRLGWRWFREDFLHTKPANTPTAPPPAPAP